MTKSLNGSTPLASQESALKFQEAKGYELQTIAPDPASPPFNVATLKQLPTGNVPAALHLTAAALPAGKTAFWTGQMYSDGQMKATFAYRD